MSLLAQAGTAAVLAMALVSLAAAAARAQVPEGGAATPLSVWRLGLSADSMWYENALFLDGTSSSWSTGGRASLDWARRFQSGTFDLGAYGGSIYYPELNSFRQATYGGHLGLNAAPSARTQFTLCQTFARTNTRQLTFDSGDMPAADDGPLHRELGDRASPTACRRAGSSGCTAPSSCAATTRPRSWTASRPASAFSSAGSSAARARST